MSKGLLGEHVWIGRKVAVFAVFLVFLSICIGCANEPITHRSVAIHPIVLDGPVRGFVARIDLTDPGVLVRVVPASFDDPDGEGPCVTRLDEVRTIARRNNLDLAINASFFAAPASREVMGKDVHYFIGNPAYPLGWIVSDGQLICRPSNRPAPSLVVYPDRVEIASDLTELPIDAREIVSGSEMLVEDGLIVVRDIPPLHPRTAIGLNSDRTELILLVIDGRREKWSRGVTLKQLAEIMRELGAHDAINLDGGGSTTMVQRVSGKNYRIVNRPSDGSDINASISKPRAVCDAVGVRILP